MFFAVAERGSLLCGALSYREAHYGKLCISRPMMHAAAC
jgi:hypothetical protein